MFLDLLMVVPLSIFLFIVLFYASLSEAFVTRYYDTVGITITQNRKITLWQQSSSQFSGAFDSDRIDALTERGVFEAQLMQGDVGVLEDIAQMKSSNNKKKKKKKNKDNKGPSISQTVRVLEQEGVVRLNGILPKSTAATLREDILTRRDDAYAAISSDVGGGDSWRNYFADVMLKTNRCDLLLPLEGNESLQKALHEILVESNKLSSIISTAMGGGNVDNEATLYEMSALISDPGSPRQPIHPDNPYQEHAPLYTAFISLQDVSNEMGPTTFLPRTNTENAHDQYNDIPKRDSFLESRSSVEALLNTGDASLFDSRTMHFGGANDKSEGATRVLLYLSFRNPKATESIGNVGSIHPSVKRMTLNDLRSYLNGNSLQQEEDKTAISNDELLHLAEGGDVLSQLKLGIYQYGGENGLEVSYTKAAHWFELAAAQGNGHAQFNLGCMNSLGIGVEQPSVERAIELFQLSADQNHPGAKEALAEQKSKMTTL